MRKLFSQIASASLGLWIATIFISGASVVYFADSSIFGIPITAKWQMFLVLGIILGVMNYFIAPILETLALPLEIVTLGLFSLVIDAGLLWFLDLTFEELKITWMWPLIYTTLIIWVLNLIISKLISKKD